ncbi:MAG: Gfo/Idh/MocA family oxidoreductase [Planctomycetes bacterium]|nr:Gfo/Idh/MocA family oxidoreductase [Planctomycetota bacterium]
MRRRAFLKAAGGLAGAGIFFWRRGFAVAPSERIVVGHIGVGGMGNTHVNWFAGHPDVETAAICDVDKGHREGTLKRLQGMKPGTPAKAYADFREVLDRSDIDAVTCATPDHWHALIAILAFQAGKDVYGEKPLSYSLLEGRAMLDACRKYERIFQLGTQIHAGENYHRVVDLVRSGILGEIRTVRAWKTGGAPFIEVVPDRDPPEGFDYDTWLGPAPLRKYNPNRTHFRFRYFWDYSGGTYADFWCHICDIVFWALAPKAGPSTIEARGEPNTEGMAETHKWIDVDFQFPGFKLLWTTEPPKVPGAAGRGIGAQFEGTKGSLVTDYGDRVLFLDGKQVKDVEEVPKTTPRSPGHQRNFLDSVKSRVPTQSNLEYVHPMTCPMHLGNISFRLKRKLRWDPEKERVIDDEKANGMLLRTFRAPWKLPG